MTLSSLVLVTRSALVKLDPPLVETENWKSSPSVLVLWNASTWRVPALLTGVVKVHWAIRLERLPLVAASRSTR